MTKEQEDWLVAEVMDSMKMSETEERSARRYVKRAWIRSCLLQPWRSAGAASQHCSTDCWRYVEGWSGKDRQRRKWQSINRGDTAISYRDGSGNQKATVDFMKNYEKSLNRFKKINLPKDLAKWQKLISLQQHTKIPWPFTELSKIPFRVEKAFLKAVWMEKLCMKMWNAHCLHIQVESCSNRNLLRRRKQLFVCLIPSGSWYPDQCFLVITHFGKKIEAVARFSWVLEVS